MQVGLLVALGEGGFAVTTVWQGLLRGIVGGRATSLGIDCSERQYQFFKIKALRFTHSHGVQGVEY